MIDRLKKSLSEDQIQDVLVRQSLYRERKRRTGKDQSLKLQLKGRPKKTTEVKPEEDNYQEAMILDEEEEVKSA